MKSKLKKIFVSFLLMTIADFASSSPLFWDLGLDKLQSGLLFVLGLFFGPYGALGATLSTLMTTIIEGFSIETAIYSAIIVFGVTYLAYKLWYANFKFHKTTKPRLNNVFNLVLFLSIILICGAIYSVLICNLISILFFDEILENISITYFFNFVNTAFIYGIISIWLSKRIDFIETPKTSKRSVNKRAYQILFSLLIILTIISFISGIIDPSTNIMIGQTLLILILLYGYLTKPFGNKIEKSDENTIIEKIIRNFIIITLIIAIFGIAISYFNFKFLESIHINFYIIEMPLLIIPDIIILLFFIPGIIILKYVENKVIKPISAFSEIERFIEENEKIEAEGLVNVYSKYVNEQNEIGTLARSYTDLITHNNNYIENIREIEGEKERINAELDIATNIQAASLPTEAIENDDLTVRGYSKPAKEVGGDFFDYYLLDEDNLAIVIGDASGKGVPAALVAMITQVMIKQMLAHDKDPSKVLCTLNNQLCENNTEFMFITLWLGVYNKTTEKLTFSNAGHNPPLIRENNEFRYLDMDTGIVIGIMEGFDYVKEEITLTDELVLYTDGIIDAHNKDEEMFGEERLLRFFNEFKGNADAINHLLNEIDEFENGTEQFDDMTLLNLKIK